MVTEEFRITLLSRSTKYRKILNQDELVGAMRNVPMFKVTVVDYTWQMPFLDQLKVEFSFSIELFIFINNYSFCCCC